MNHRTAKPLVTLLIGLNLAFIWGNSAMTGQQSGEISGGLLQWIAEIFPIFAQEQGHFLLRKLAHFSEFACLGLLCSLRKLLRGEPIRLSLAGFGLCAACIDETVQMYVPGRASSLTDVWIDTAGFVTGSLLVSAGYALYKKVKN